MNKKRFYKITGQLEFFIKKYHGQIYPVTHDYRGPLYSTKNSEYYLVTYQQQLNEAITT